MIILAVLALLAAAADFVVARHGHFSFEDLPGFYGLLALAITLAAVFLSAGIGILITRPEEDWDD